MSRELRPQMTCAVWASRDRRAASAVPGAPPFQIDESPHQTNTQPQQLPARLWFDDVRTGYPIGNGVDRRESNQALWKLNGPLPTQTLWRLAAAPEASLRLSFFSPLRELDGCRHRKFLHGTLEGTHQRPVSRRRRCLRSRQQDLDRVMPAVGGHVVHLRCRRGSRGRPRQTMATGFEGMVRALHVLVSTTRSIPSCRTDLRVALLDDDLSARRASLRRFHPSETAAAPDCPSLRQGESRA